MGSGIGYVIGQAGPNVVLVDIKEEYVKSGLDRIKQDVKEGISRGKMSPMDGMKLVQKFSISTDLAEACKDADLVIEAVFESMEVKKQVFGTLSDNAKEDAILATNTSTLSISEIAESVKNPSRVIGMHFFSPVSAMKLVEVISGKQTSVEVKNTLMEFSKKIGKEPIAAKDSPGFLVNRLLLPMLNEAIKAYEAGIATKEQIDDISAGKYGFPAGPFLLSDNVGLDVAFHAMKTLENAWGECYKPCKSLADLVEAGNLGMKTGKGFFNYKKGEENIVEDPKPGDFDVLITIAPMVNEAYRLLDEEVATKEDIDRAMMLGARFPKGPFALAKDFGLKVILEKMREFESSKGPCYKPAETLVKEAA
ncbi:MAG: hypothetical protein INQ03_15380 [Candidatus Heimdallarchaeota archaeon]|nr:hypothetical protein [Candidatus Heimdallarchaeota archaeon]